MLAQASVQQKALIMAGVMLGMFTSAMNQTVVATAMPRIVAHLGGLELYSWIFTSFMLTSTTVVPIVGKLSDIYGRKPFYIGGLIVFLLGSALGGLSQNMLELIIFRGVQGLGAGVLMGLTFVIVADVFTPAQRPRFQGLMASVFAFSSVIGPLIGGYITDNLNWRWVFYVNLPIGIIALAVIYRVLPPLKVPGVQSKIDYWGVTLMTVAIIPLLLALVWGGHQYPWASAQILGLFALAAVASAAFILAETRAAEPILPLSLFRNPIYTVSIAVVFLTAIGMFGSMTYIPLFIQGVIGASATNSGLVTMPMSLAMAVASTLGGQLLARWGRYRLLGVIGVGIMVTGMFLLSRMTMDTSRAEVVRNMVIMGMGLGIGMPLYTLVVQNALPYNVLGVATSSIQFFRSIGGTLGVAILGSLVTTTLTREMAQHMPQQVTESVPSEMLRPFENPQILLNAAQLARVQQGFQGLGDNGPVLFDQALTSVRESLALAIGTAFLMGLVIAAIALMVSFFLQEVPLRQRYGPAEAETSPARPNIIPPQPKSAGAEPNPILDNPSALGIEGEDG